MNIKTLSLRGSPYLGVFCAVSDSIALVPTFLDKKETKRIEETMSVEVIPTTLADSHLVGAMARGLGKKFAVAHTINGDEKKELESLGLQLHVMKEITAIGNLLCLQKNGGIISPLITMNEAQRLEQFFGIALHSKMVAKSELAGACVLATEKGFLAHPKTEPAEMEALEAIFKVPGMTTTANYGDAFVGNSILANAHGILVGERTSGPELARIDEGLHPGLTQ